MNRIPFPRCDQLFQQDSTKVLHIAVLACDQVYTLNIFDLVEGKKQRVPVDRLEAYVEPPLEIEKKGDLLFSALRL
jgi:carnitine O-acetyltransferase